MSEIEQSIGRAGALRVRPAAAADVARRVAAVAALAGIVVCTAEVVIGAAAGPSFLVPASQASFPGWIAGPLHGLAGGTLSQGGYAAWTFAMFALYLVALKLIGSLSLRLVAGAVVVCHVLLALSPPLTLTDLFNYLGFARLGAVHHLSPYTHAVISVRSDPVVPFDSWRHLQSPYGPLFTLLSYAAAPLGVAGGLWALKTSAAVFSLACVALLGWTARRLGRDPLPAVALMGLNPLVLLFGVGGGHNDFLMLLLLVGAVSLSVARHEAVAAVSIVVAAAVKASAAVVLPFQVLGARNRRASLAGAVASAAAGAGLSLALFGPHLLNGVQTQSRCLSKLSVPDAVGRLLGFGGASAGVHIALVLLAAGMFAWQLSRTRRGHWLVPAGWAMLAVLAALTWYMPWYVAWVIPLAALGESRRLRAAMLVACVYSLLVWIPPVNTAISHALPRANPHLTGCTRGAHAVERHKGWATGFL